VQIISGNYFCQHNDGDEDGDKTCGDEVGIGMLLHPHVTLYELGKMHNQKTQK